MMRPALVNSTLFRGTCGLLVETAFPVGPARISTATSSSLPGTFLLGLRRYSSVLSHSTNAIALTNNIIPLDQTHQFCLVCPHDNRRWYTPLTQEEEDKEKARVSHLSTEEKEKELRQLNREITKLETLRGINTGELYTWSGRYKALVKNYGFPLFVYYWTLWTTMGVSIYLLIDFGGFDAMSLLDKIDTYMGWSLSQKVDPQLGKMGLALVVNECLEPVRLPFVVVTLKPVMDVVSPPKY